ncbi:MAG: hypothetical protein ACRDZ8_04845, partial [Acidimicrobiales bacterium]
MARRPAYAVPPLNMPVLALFDQPNAPSRMPPPPPRPRHANWEGPLSALVGTGRTPAEQASAAQIGLLFELVASRPAAGRRSGPGSPGIRVCPVLPGRAGNWVKSGINWYSLDYVGYGWPKAAHSAETLALIKEFLALSQLMRLRYASSYPGPAIWLEDLNSRRVWDLLRQAREAEVPLVCSGRRSPPVVLPSSPAEVFLDVTRTGRDLLVDPQVTHDNQAVPLSAAVLLGTPAHGIAWWLRPAPAPGTSGGAATNDLQLYLAPFATPVDDTLRPLLGRPALRVPGKDTERFLREFLPALRRKVPLRSSDESVEVPAEAPVTLVLSLVHGEGHHVDLSWDWSPAGTERGAGIWESRAGGYGRDRAAED